MKSFYGKIGWKLSTQHRETPVIEIEFQAIEARSVDQEKVSHVNSLTLCFRDSDKERQYQEDPDIGKAIDT